MTRAEPSCWKRELPWLLAVCVLAGLGGWAGQAVAQSRGHALSKPTAPAAAGDIPAAQPLRRPGPTESPEERLAGVLRRLQNLCDESACPENDPEWQAAVGEMLAGMSAAELAQLQARIDPVMNAANPELSAMLLHHWIRKDPDAALAAAARWEGVRAGVSLSRTFREWSAEHPQEALAWLDASQLPVARQRRAELLAGLMSSLAGRDLQAALTEYRKLPPEDAGQVMAGWASDFASDPGMREKLIALAQEPGAMADPGVFYHSLLDRWGEFDKEAAQAWLDAAGLPEPLRTRAQESLQNAQGTPGDGAALSQWLASQPPDATLLPQQLNQMRAWITQRPDAALAWVNDLTPGLQRDVLLHTAVPALSFNRKFDQAAAVIALVQDPALHEDAVRTLNLLWSAAAPEQAAAWKAGLEGSNKSSASPAPR